LKTILLNNLETTLEWAKSMTWKGANPVVKLLEISYQKGVRMGKKAFNAIADRIERDAHGFLIEPFALFCRP